MDYTSINYLATPFFPKWETSQRRSTEGIEYPLLNLYPKIEPVPNHQRTSPFTQERPLPYPRCSPYYPFCVEAMLDTHPSAFHPAGKSSNKAPSVISSESLDRPSQLPLFYEDRRICTCRCFLPAPRSPPCLENLYKRESNTTDQEARVPLKPTPGACFPGFYRWLLPNRRYLHEDVPLGLRLSTMTTPSPLITRESEKRPVPKRFQCTHCEKSFGKSSHLRDHIRTHTGDRPYRCQYCEKAFTQYSNLRTHTRIHTGERPYRCRHCNKSFTQAVTLRSHTRTHTGHKAYHCKQCTKSFACFSGLKEHISIHDIENSHETRKNTNTEITPSIKQEKEDTKACKI